MKDYGVIMIFNNPFSKDKESMKNDDPRLKRSGPAKQSFSGNPIVI